MIHIYKKRVTSTQDILKENFKTLNHGTYLCAGQQTKGHGQFDRKWESLEDQNVLCSLLIKNDKTYEDIQIQVSLIMIELLKKYDITATFKEPNDVMYESKKLCGVLVDQIILGSRVQAIVIGVGLNVNQVNFNHDIATSMANIKNKQFDLDAIKYEVYDALKRFL